MESFQKKFSGEDGARDLNWGRIEANMVLIAYVPFIQIYAQPDDSRPNPLLLCRRAAQLRQY